MKKRTSFLLALCLMLGSLALTLPTPVLATGLTSFDLTLNYTDTNVNNGIVNHTDQATLTAVTKDGLSALQVVPNLLSANAGKAIALDHYSYSSRNLALSGLKTIAFYTYYEGPTTLSKAQLRILPGLAHTLTGTVAVNSRETIQKDTWQWLTFDVSEALYGKILNDSVLSQFHYFPFGTGPANGLTANDAVYISKIRLSSTTLFDVTADYSGSITINGNSKVICQGLVDRQDYATTATVTVKNTDANGVEAATGVNAISVTPNPNGSDASHIIALDHYSYITLGIPREDVKYIAFEYCYAGSTPLTSAKMRVLGTNPKMLTAREPIEFGKTVDGNAVTYTWRWMYFDVGTAYADLSRSDEVMLTQFHFMPYGNVSAQSLSANDVMYVSKIRFISEDLRYKASFAPGRPDVTGNAPAADVFVNVGDKIVLPANTYSRAHHAFSSYICSADQTVYYQPGDEYLVASVPTGAGLTDALPRLWFLPAFSYTGPLYFGCEPVKAVDYSDWFSSVNSVMLNGAPFAVATKNQTFDGHSNVLKVEPIITCSSPRNLVLDSWSWANLPWNMDYYKYVKVEYYLATGNNILSSYHPQLRLMTTSLSAPQTFTAQETVAANTWGTLTFDLTGQNLSPGIPAGRHMMRQAHFIWQPTSQTVANFAAGTTLYIGKFTLYRDDPDAVPQPTGYNVTAGDQKIAEVNNATASRIAEIRATPNTVTPASVTTGTVYYISSSTGSTSNAGTSASAPYRISTLSEVNTKVKNATIQSGDVLLFKRGDTFRGQLSTVAGVTYSAYGTGAKPVFIRNTETGASNAANWTLDYENTTTGAKIWKYANTALNDVGAICLIDGGNITVAYKEIPNYSGGQWWVRGQVGTTAFDRTVELDRDLEFVQLDPPNGSSGNCIPQTGPIYLRCDAGNPGSVYSQIEFNLRGNCIGAKSGVTVDNLCIKHFGSHGIGAGSVKNLTVTNCEIGWGGGSIQYYNMNASGKVTRFGNGVEIYGGLRNYTVEDCYVYQIYDAGVTHQISATSAGNYFMENVSYRNNVMEYSTYNIEYFMSKDNADNTTERFMKDVSIDGNILRKAGYGWGVQRPDHAPSNIKGWTHYNKAMNFTITGNVIDRTYNKVGGNGSSDWLAQVGASFVVCEPYFEDNVFIQTPGRLFALIATTTYSYDSGLPETAQYFGAQDNDYYYCSEGSEEAAVDTVYHAVMP